MNTHREKEKNGRGWPAPCGLCKGRVLTPLGDSLRRSKHATLLGSLEQSVLIGGIFCANASLFRSPVSASKTGTVILCAKMLDRITAIGDRIRTSGRGLCELLSAGANHAGANAGANHAGANHDAIRSADPAAIRRLAGGKCDQRKEPEANSTGKGFRNHWELLVFSFDFFGLLSVLAAAGASFSASIHSSSSFFIAASSFWMLSLSCAPSPRAPTLHASTESPSTEGLMCSLFKLSNSLNCAT